jgi:hypothetical protein
MWAATGKHQPSTIRLNHWMITIVKEQGKQKGQTAMIYYRLQTDPETWTPVYYIKNILSIQRGVQPPEFDTIALHMGGFHQPTLLATQKNLYVIDDTADRPMELCFFQQRRLI